MSQVELKNQFVSFRIEEGVLISVFAEGSYLDLDAIQKCERARKVLLDGNSYPVITDFTKVDTLTQEAKQYTNSEKYIVGFNSIAVLVDAKWKEMLANVYIKFRRFDLPMRVFSDFEQARIWSNGYAEKSLSKV